MTTDNETNKSAIIAGMAPGFGEALVRALAEKGFSVAGLSRTKTVDLSDLDGSYTHFECDLTDPARVEETIEAVSQEHGAPTVLIYNAMQLIPKPFLELTPEDFQSSWMATCFGAMISARAVIPGMLAAGQGTIIFTGATAALKGNPRFAAFASAKFALRGLAQSLAREFGPQGVHVVHSVLDGIIWGPQAQERFNVKRENCLDATAIANSYIHLIKQSPEAWTHEFDMRPFNERF
ncbi:MAG: hypothetical protein CMI63_14410 [Parvularcula sp.]|nr:hypothetical protein [Parvularcula sp.]